EVRVPGDGHLDHQGAVLVRADVAVGLVGRARGREEEDALQPEADAEFLRNDEVTQVDRVERAAEDPEPCALAPGHVRSNPPYSSRDAPAPWRPTHIVAFRGHAARHAVTGGTGAPRGRVLYSPAEGLGEGVYWSAGSHRPAHRRERVSRRRAWCGPLGIAGPSGRMPSSPPAAARGSASC